MKPALGQVVEAKLVGNIYDKNRDAEIKKASEKVKQNRED
jgi:hypothetical protein